jgi:hypothetical protein
VGVAQPLRAEEAHGLGLELPERATTQQECDAIQADARFHPIRPTIRRDMPPRPPLAPTDDVVEARLAEEIEYAQRLLEAVGDRFVSDPLILQRHQTTMQSFDIIGQLLGHLAKVMGADDKLDAIDRIGMHELRARLKRPMPTVSPAGTLGSFRRSSL